MLSLYNVGTGQTAASYYEMADDYYTCDGNPSQWWGHGADFLGLHGEVDPAVFGALLDGHLPNGEALHRAAAGRRGGTDATFSAPKSVSLQALIGGDERLVDAHRLAVDRALNYAQHLAACRVTEAGITRSERTSNLLVARFDHDLSRAFDPQLHTHCVMINATRRVDGQWRALDNQIIYRHKMLLGALYRAELAREVQTLGYRIRLTHIDGRFELAHLNETQVKAFSQRSAAIEAYLKTHKGLERDEASAWDKKLAAVVTRAKKTDADREVLFQEWAGVSADHGIDYNLPVQPAVYCVKANAGEILSQAIEHVSERRSVFSGQEIVQIALERGVGLTILNDIEVALEEFIRDGKLIRNGERYTTAEAQQLERDILSAEVMGRASLTPIYQGNRTALSAQLSGLSDGQRDAVLGILLTGNQIIGIQGRAGVGKTTLLKVATEQASACGYVVKGVAPSASASRELEGVGIDAETISAFNHRQTINLDARTLLIVDEAGMASTRQLHLILSKAAKAGCRVVLVGDTAQLQSVEAGKPFAQLQLHGMHTAVVNQIQRQKKNSILKHAVELAVDGQISMSVEVLDKHILEIANKVERFQRIANDYVNLSESERTTARVISGTRNARAEINRIIRLKLGLAEQGHDFVLLDRKDQTLQQARSILSYDVGDLVLAETDYPSLKMKRGDISSVVERLANCILLEHSDGTRITWQPALATNLTSYVPVTRSLSIGDIVRVTANDRLRGLVNGDIAKVHDVNPDRKELRLLFEGGRIVCLDGRRPLALPASPAPPDRVHRVSTAAA